MTFVNFVLLMIVAFAIWVEWKTWQRRKKKPTNTSSLPKPNHSILSERSDGFGFYYGYVPGDYRQLNVRYELNSTDDSLRPWCCYVDGYPIGFFSTKHNAEIFGVEYIIATHKEDNENE